jgi:hypothetical protein
LGIINGTSRGAIVVTDGRVFLVSRIENTAKEKHAIMLHKDHRVQASLSSAI